MTSAEIRQSFLDFFASQGHTIVPSSSLLPDSPGLLFTNAGMNQFVPIFLGEKAPNVASWAGARPAKDTRAADTQKCIRAGGKHNDLEDVGYDTYHHTLFEMLGNWSFGDYFKQDSLTWGWHLLTKVWGIPAKRLFATVYAPKPGDPSEFDTEANAIWTELFKAEGLDPVLHIVHGNRKDNFWQMGDTGPCGPCSEIHFNLLVDDNEVEGRKGVNSSSPRCIEIWNHVFIQFNANADGTFSPLAAKHVDTGMGFERVAGIYANTKGFTDFAPEPSNYSADVFAPLFAKITELSGKTYLGTVPTKREGLTEQEITDVAFRVLADHARTISCSIADGIMPGNEGRNYVIRRILRRGILYGTKLGLKTGFFEQLVAPVVLSLGSVFPELVERQDIIRRVIKSEEESFGRTLDRGLAIFNKAAVGASVITGALAFELYDTYGFPLDMTQLLATERGLTVDTEEFERLMEEQRNRGRASTKKEIIVAATEGADTTEIKPTQFTGYLSLTTETTLIDVVKTEKDTYLVFEATPFYAEMGGQVGDTGESLINGQLVHITDTIKDKSGRYLHKVAKLTTELSSGSKATLSVDATRRRAINRHHTATHLLHWALRKVIGTHVRQAGSLNTPDRLRFDFAHFESVTPAQLREIEGLVNERILENATVTSYETDFDKKPEGTLAFFGEKYGKTVRVVDAGGYSRELCGGTHVSTTGEIGLVKIVSEGAVAAGTRRLEAVSGQAAYDHVSSVESQLAATAAKIGVPLSQLDQKIDALLAQKAETDKKLKAFEQRAAAVLATELAAKAVTTDGLARVSAVVTVEAPEALREIGSQVLAKLGEGVVILGAAFGPEKVSLVAFASPAAIKAGHQAGKIISALTAQLGGKGGGKPDFAMGGGKDAAKLAEVLG
ncbi:alanine--tRNA ligase [Rariglobus hedericola]|uniref:Alanine--tRNA ligase n=1 Tax=Rariglobus hedericola TaxID=2597822 RepID=A0A556QNF6_9BACT|nr:alanine--tRNA ligase [Rariglobus hedericola]TSJ78176.1 alanine--tRNA ligase [Rariglobus hedericola]